LLHLYADLIISRERIRKKLLPIKREEGVMSDSKVVASKIKTYIKDKSGMNTSTTVFDALTSIVEKEIDKAIENAQANKRKTVMDRDFM